MGCIIWLSYILIILIPAYQHPVSWSDFLLLLLFCPIIKITSNLPSILYVFASCSEQMADFKGCNSGLHSSGNYFSFTSASRSSLPGCLSTSSAERSGTPAVLMQSQSYWRKNPDVALHSGLLKLLAVKVLCLTVLIKMGTLTDITA